MDHTADSPVNAKKWGLATDWMINHIRNLALPEQVKDALIDKAVADYSISKSGANSFKQLQCHGRADVLQAAERRADCAGWNAPLKSRSAH